VNLLQRVIVRTINGAIQIGARLWRWPWETKEGRERLRRAIALVAAGWSLYRLAGRWHWIGEVAVGVALICAYRVADEVVVDQQAEDEEISSKLDGIPEPTVEQLQAALIETIRTLGDGSNGVHLDRILIGWQEAGLADPDMTLSEFRQTIEHLGIPVRSSLKVSGVVRIGVHLDDLPKPQVSDPGQPPDTTPPAVPDDLFQDW
jgi:hypothetical protein